MKNRGGFTVIETIISLAVASTLFAIMITTFSGRQGRVEFAQGMRDIESHIQDVANDVRNGYYPNSGQKCSVPPTGSISFNTLEPSEQGKSSVCVFMGKVLFFESNSENNKSNIRSFSVAGDRLATSNSKLKQALIGSPGTEISEEYVMPAGIKMIDSYKSAKSNLIGFLFDVNVSGASSTKVSPYIFRLASPDINGIRSSVQSAFAVPPNNTADSLAESKVLCFASGTSNQNATITIRPSTNGISTSLIIGSSIDASTGC